MFRTAPLSMIRNFSLYTQQWYIPDFVQRNCPKHVVFYSKNELEKLVHLVGFIIRTKEQLMQFNVTDVRLLYYGQLHVSAQPPVKWVPGISRW